MTTAPTAGPPPTISSPERPGNTPAYDPVTHAPLTGNTRPVVPGTPLNPNARSVHIGAPLGLYFVGALAVLAMADTQVAPVLAAFLTAAAIYNANYLLLKYKH